MDVVPRGLPANPDFEIVEVDARPEPDRLSDGALGFGGFQHGAILVKTGKLTGEFVQVIAKEVRPVIVSHRLQSEAEVEKVSRQSQFFRRGQNQFRVPRSLLRVFPGLAEDRADARVGVLQIRRGVALQR